MSASARMRGAGRARRRSLQSLRGIGAIGKLALFAVFTAACGDGGCGGRVKLETLPRPLFVEARGNSSCGGSGAIDAKGAMWTEGGCSSEPLPFKKVGQLDAEHLHAFQGTLEKIRATPAPDGGAPCAEGFRSFALYDSAGPPRVWTYCVFKGEKVPAPFDVAGVVAQ